MAGGAIIIGRLRIGNGNRNETNYGDHKRQKYRASAFHTQSDLYKEGNLPYDSQNRWGEPVPVRARLLPPSHPP